MKPRQNDAPDSTKLAIEMLEIPERRSTTLSVQAVFKGEPVTEAMVAAEVKLLNEVCGLHGKTLKKLARRRLAFKVVTLH